MSKFKFLALFLKVIQLAGNFRLEKIFAFFAQARRGRKFFRRIILPSENFVTLKFFTRGCQAVLVVPHDHQSAVLPGIQNLLRLLSRSAA